tara:strand:+ start:3041 stop:3244 length:204 start_codon:yes stop_codon:yes gene_type:complete
MSSLTELRYIKTQKMAGRINTIACIILPVISWSVLMTITNARHIATSAMIKDITFPHTLDLISSLPT